MMFYPKDNLDKLLTLAKKAGEAIMRYHSDGYDVHYKKDGSPVSQADQASEDIIIAGLNTLAPDIPVIAEEQSEAGDNPDIAQESRYWLIDPLDGTKEFAKGSKDFTVNIGLIENGQPVFGIVYLPATQDLYYSGEGIGAFKNNEPMKTLSYKKEKGLIIIGSASHPDKDKNRKRQELLKDHKIQSFTTRGSGLKFCLIADGTAHLYPRYVPTFEWDTAAAHAMLLQVGGDIIDSETGIRLAYGKQSKDFRNGSLITGTDEVLKQLTLK